MALDASLTLSSIRYVSRVKWNNPGKGVAPSPTPQCSSYRKGNLQITLDYGRQLYFTYGSKCNWENSKEKSEQFSEKSFYNFSDSDY